MTAMTAADRNFSRILLCLAAACACAGPAIAGPAAPVVSAGGASYNPATLTVTSTSARTQISWPSFSLAAGETFKFVQPNAQSVVLNQVFDPRSLHNLGGVSSNGSVYFLSDGRVSGAGVNLNLAGMISTSLRMPRMALASERAPQSDGPRALTTLAAGSIYVIGEDEQALTTDGGNVLLNPGRTVELAHAGMLNLRVLLTAPGSEAINLSRLLGAGRETGIFAGLFRVPAAARQSTQHDAQPAMIAAADAPESAEMQRFRRYALLYAQMRRELRQRENGMMQVAAVSGSRRLLASAKSRPSLLPQDIEIGAPAARAAGAGSVAAPAPVAPALSAATAEPQAIPAAQDEAGPDGVMLLALAPVLSAAETVATPEPQAIPAAVESEPHRAILLALASRQTSEVATATLEPQPIPAAIAIEQESRRALPAALADARALAAVVATLEPLPIPVRAGPESGELRSLARELAAAPQPLQSAPVQVAQLPTTAERHEVHAPLPEPAVIVVALSQHAAAPAPAAHAEVKEIHIERKAPRYFTDYRGAMFFM